MTAPAPKFRSVPATPLDVPDDELNQFSDDLGIPALIKPEPKVSETPSLASEAGARNSPVEAISALAAPAPAAKTKKRATTQKTAPSVDPLSGPNRRISIDIPPIIAEQLRRRAFEERATARFFLLSGLKAIGFEVPDSELVPDARREEFRN